MKKIYNTPRILTVEIVNNANICEGSIQQLQFSNSETATTDVEVLSKGASIFDDEE